jgi:hypothetical protein
MLYPVLLLVYIFRTHQIRSLVFSVFVVVVIGMATLARLVTPCYCGVVGVDIQALSLSTRAEPWLSQPSPAKGLVPSGSPPRPGCGLCIASGVVVMISGVRAPHRVRSP